MLARNLRKIGLALVTVVACSTTEHGAAKDSSASRAGADSSPVTTREMIEALTRDVSESDRELAAVEDSIGLFIGDTVAVLLKQRRASWEQYRKLECDAIRVAFAEGSMASIAHMECWIDLTDDHRRFLAEHYGYMLIGRPASGKQIR